MVLFRRLFMVLFRRLLRRREWRRRQPYERRQLGGARIPRSLTLLTRHCGGWGRNWRTETGAVMRQNGVLGRGKRSSTSTGRRNSDTAEPSGRHSLGGAWLASIASKHRRP